MGNTCVKYHHGRSKGVIVRKPLFHRQTDGRTDSHGETSIPPPYNLGWLKRCCTFLLPDVTKWKEFHKFSDLQGYSPKFESYEESFVLSLGRSYRYLHFHIRFYYYYYTPVFRRDVLWYGDVRPSGSPSVRLSVRPTLRPSGSPSARFPHFSHRCFDILSWNFAHDFVFMYYRSSLRVVPLRQFL